MTTQVFDYQNYREYLRDYYLAQKKEKAGFTYARFSLLAGLGSPNYFKLIMDGQKNLTNENLVRFCHALKLGDLESEYFETLVYFNQAKNNIERDYYQQRLKRIKKRTGQGRERVLEEYEFDVMSNWLYSAILVMTNIKSFRENPEFIKQRLFDLVSEEEVTKVLSTLQKLGLTKRDEDGRLRQTTKTIKTKADFGRLAARNFYEGLLTRAVKGFQLSEPHEREFGAYLVGISEKQMPELKKRVRAFMADLYEWALQNPDPEEVYALTFGAFPLTIHYQRAKQ